MQQAVIYARVSSKDQEVEGFSIPAQLKALQEYAGKHGYSIIKEFTDVETAKKAGRTEFNKMLSFLEDNPVTHILVEKTDRLLRNMFDYAVLERSIERLGINIHLVKENTVLNSLSRSNEKFIFGIKALMAKNYVDNLADEVKKGMTEKAEQGIYPSGAPYGYVNVRESGKSILKVDPEAASYIRRMFELYATGSYSLLTLLKKMLSDGMIYKNGKTLHHSNVEHILKNEFYTGIFYWRGKRYDNATHEPLVSKELFQRVQDVLISPYKSKSKKGLFTYSNLIRCKACGCKLVAELKKGKYIYYHCTNYTGTCKKEYVRQEAIDKQFTTLFKDIYISDEIKEIILSSVKESLREKIEYHNILVSGLERQIKVLQNRLDAAYIDKLDGKITDDFWQAQARKWREEKDNLARSLFAAQQADDQYLDGVSLILELVQNAGEWFKAGTLEKKRRVLELLLSNCCYGDGNIDVELKPVVGMIFKSVKSENWCARKESNLRPTD